MSRRFAHFGVMVILAGVPWQSLALSPNKVLTQYTQTVWTQAEGLPQDTIRAITQTPDGYLWLGTNEGLARFDGYEFVTFSKADGSLPSNSVRALGAGRGGVLWIGTAAGLTRYANGRFATYKPKDGLPERAITSLVEDDAGVLWMAFGGLLARFENGQFTTLSRESVAPVQVVQVVYEDQQRRLWVSGVGGLVQRAGEGFRAALDSRTLGDDFITVLWANDAGVWMGGNKGLILMRPDGTRKRYQTRDGLPSDIVRALWQDRAGNFWAGTNGGLSRFESGHFVSAARPSDEDTSDWVWSLFEDREGDLWAGMNSSLTRLRKDRFVTYGRNEGWPSDQPIVVRQDRLGTLWVGYHDRGVFAVRDGQFRSYTTQQGLASNEVFGIREAPDGDLLIATRKGLSRFHEGHFTNYVLPDPLGRTVVYDALVDAAGRLWASTASGVYRLDGTKWNWIVQGGQGVAGITIALTQRRDGSLWAAMLNAGIWQVTDPQHRDFKPRHFTTADGLSSNQARTLFEDLDGSLWIGTLGSGVTELRDGVFYRYGAHDGLLSDNISHVEDDGRGNLWLSTTRGLCRISKRGLRDFSAGKIQSLKPHNYGLEDGLRSAQCAPGFPTGGGATRSSDGHLWFPTGHGLSTIDPASSAAEGIPQSAPSTQIVEVAVDGEVVDVHTASQLKPGTGRIQFRYSGIYLRAPEAVRYWSKLEGLDPDWVPDGSRRVVNYNPLPHGRYQFRVRAMLPGGAPSDAEFSFEVLPHFYQTGWFYALCLASFLGAVYGIYLLRLRQMRGRFALVLDERARLAREIHDTLAQGFVGISSQLEALAIKLNGDLEVARQHLDLARKMARHSLTEARQSVMDLRTSKQEKRDLQEALETSAHRWVAGSSVNLQMDVAGDLQQVPEDVEQNLLRIAQEAVTNVLKHAKARVIWVKLEIQDRVLRLHVRDDGQGFEPAGAFLIADGHFGILGMRERAQRLGGKFSLESHPGAGTLVEVSVPLAARSNRYR